MVAEEDAPAAVAEEGAPAVAAEVGDGRERTPHRPWRLRLLPKEKSL